MRTAIVLGLVLFLAGCGPALPAASASPAAGAPGQVASAPRITPPAVTPPTAPGTNLPAFACADSRAGTVGVANVFDVRVETQPGYDRFVLQFDTSAPTYTVKRQAKPVFKSVASGQTITLSGTSGAIVQVHTAGENSTYSGPTDFTHPEFPVLIEARLIDDSKGYVSWGIGLTRPACLRTFTLGDPSRLVVDFATTSS